MIFKSLILILLCVFLGIGFLGHPLKGSNGYYILVILTLLFFGGFLKLLSTKFQFDRRRSLIGGGFVVFGFVLLLPFVHADSVWGDEVLQAMAAFFKNDISRASAFLLQPPLSLLFSSVSIQIFGLTEFSIRIFSVVFTVLSGLWLILFFDRRSSKIWLWLVFAVFYISTPQILWFAVEGRHYAFALFCEIIFISFVNQHLKKKDTTVSAELVISGFFLLMAINFQSFVIMSSFFISGLFFMRSSFKRTLQYLYLSLFCSALMALPIYITLNKTIQNTYQKALSPSLSFQFQIDRILDIAKKQTSLLNFPNQEWLYFSLFIGLIGYYLFIGRRSRRIDFFVFAAVLSFLLSPLLFSLFVNRPYVPRYSLIIVPLMLVTEFLIIGFSIKKNKIVYLLTTFFCFSHLLQYPDYKDQKLVHAHWRELYKEFQSNAISGSRAYVLSYPWPGNERNDGFVALQFYHQNKVKLHSIEELRHYKRSTVEVLLSDIAEKLQPPEVYFVFERHLTKISVSSLKHALPENMEYSQLHSLDIVKIKNTHNFYSLAYDFFKIIENLDDKSSSSETTYAALLHLNLMRSNCVEAQKYKQLLRKFNSRYLRAASYKNKIAECE